MGRMRRAAEWLGLTREADLEYPSGPAAGVIPPSADQRSSLSSSSALSLSMVYRAVQIHETAAKQLSVRAERRGVAITYPALLVRKPEVERSRSATIAYTVTCMALTGNAFWRLYRLDPANPSSPVTHVEVLNPNGVIIRDDPATGTRSYDVVDDLGRHYTLASWQCQHIPLMRVPGTPYGLGPIQAARVELRGAIDLRDYTSGWFNTSGIPTGTLESDQPLTAKQASEYRDAWDSTPAGRTRVTGSGLRYRPVLISPKDAQFLESQTFTVTQIARLMGVPASLMLATVDGGAQTYANIEQDWIGYVRFGLMDYLREIEEAWSALTPNGQEVRFNVETLLRTDTKTRYEAHEIALRAGWTDIAEVRAIEGLPPRPDLKKPAPTPAPVSDDTPANPEA